MNKILLSSIFAIITTSTNLQANDPESTDNYTEIVADAVQSPITSQAICLIEGIPPKDINFTVVKRLKLGKGVYGSIEEILPKFGDLARHYKADAIIEYNGSQRFGFWPWRVVRPVLTGTAVKFQTPIECSKLNGKLI